LFVDLRFVAMPKKISCTKISRKLSTWANVTKYIMGFCFILLFLLGMVLFIISVVAVSGSNLLTDFPVQSATSIMYMGIFLGLFLAISSIVGAIGFFWLHRCLLIIFVCCIAALAVVQVVVGVVAVSYDDEEQLVLDSWNLADNSTRAYLEDSFECCGGENVTDNPSSENCTAMFGGSSSIFLSALSSSGGVQACGKVIAEFLDDYMITVGVGIIVVTLLEVAVIVVTVILVVQIDRAKKKYSKVDDDESLDPLK